MKYQYYILYYTDLNICLHERYDAKVNSFKNKNRDANDLALRIMNYLFFYAESCKCDLGICHCNYMMLNILDPPADKRTCPGQIQANRSTTNAHITFINKAYINIKRKCVLTAVDAFMKQCMYGFPFYNIKGTTNDISLTTIQEVIYVHSLMIDLSRLMVLFVSNVLSM